MNYKIDNGYVYAFLPDKLEFMVGPVNKSETIRIDTETVVDIVSLFDIELGEYVEQSRTERVELLPEEPLTPEQLKIEQLEAQIESMSAAVDFLIMNSMGGI